MWSYVRIRLDLGEQLACGRELWQLLGLGDSWASAVGHLRPRPAAGQQAVCVGLGRLPWLRAFVIVTPRSAFYSVCPGFVCVCVCVCVRPGYT